MHDKDPRRGSVRLAKPLEVKTIKIGFIASTFGVGGAENVMVNLITGLPAEQFQTETYFLKEPGIVGEELLKSGYRVTAGLLRHKTDVGVIFRLESYNTASLNKFCSSREI